MLRPPAILRRSLAIVALLVTWLMFGAALTPAAGLPLEGGTPATGDIEVLPAAEPAQPPAATPLRVASFNVRCANCSRSMRVNKREKRWEVRRAKVLDQILAEQVDVIGVQEASPGILKGTRTSQFEDLADRLGAPYQLTNTNRYGCARDTSYKSCDEVDNGASADVRIIYNTERLTLLDQGSRQLDNEKATSGPRFVAWAIFADRVDGRRFFFATAHTEPGQSKAKRALRHRQAGMILDEIADHNPENLPLVLTGDLSSTKLTAVNPVYNVLTDSGVVIDPLGNTRKQKSAAKSIVSRMIDVHFDTLNDFKTKPTSRKGYALGAHIDYILTDPRVQVPEYKVVVDLKGNRKFSGVIPSDHNMVRATILLP